MTTDELSEWLRKHPNAKLIVQAKIENYDAIEIMIQGGPDRKNPSAVGWTIEGAAARLQKLPE